MSKTLETNDDQRLQIQNRLAFTCLKQYPAQEIEQMMRETACLP